MELRALGATGLRVSPIGLGTTKLGRNEQVKYPRAFELPDDATVQRLFAIAREAGVNLIDTAPAYGTSEARIGALLEDRERWVIATKAGEEFEDGASRFDFSPEGIRASVERSLEQLRTDWLDVVLLHLGDEDEAVLRDGAAIDALRRLRDAGHVRAIGASTKTVAGGLLAVGSCDVVMVALHRDDESQLPVVEAARRADVGVLIKKALASGHDGDPASALAHVAGVAGVSSLVVGSVDPDHWAANCRAVAKAVAPA